MKSNSALLTNNKAPSNLGENERWSIWNKYMIWGFLVIAFLITKFGLSAHFHEGFVPFRNQLTDKIIIAVNLVFLCLCLYCTIKKILALQRLKSRIKVVLAFGISSIMIYLSIYAGYFGVYYVLFNINHKIDETVIGNLVQLQHIKNTRTLYSTITTIRLENNKQYMFYYDSGAYGNFDNVKRCQRNLNCDIKVTANVKQNKYGMLPQHLSYKAVSHSDMLNIRYHKWFL